MHGFHINNFDVLMDISKMLATEQSLKSFALRIATDGIDMYVFTFNLNFLGHQLKLQI